MLIYVAVSRKLKEEKQSGNAKLKIIKEYCLANIGGVFDVGYLAETVFKDISMYAGTYYQYCIIREAVCNAIIHRNYSRCNMVQIKVFPDKIMMLNNCIFPDGWTIDNLLRPHESKAINPLIADAFYRMGYIDTWGKVIEKIVNGLKEVGQEEPVFEETKYSFCLTMKPKFVMDAAENATENATDESQKSHRKVTETS